MGADFDKNTKNTDKKNKRAISITYVGLFIMMLLKSLAFKNLKKNNIVMPNIPPNSTV